MASLLYTYSTEHKPVDLNIPLWRLRVDRPLEWQALVKTLEESPRDLFQILLSVPDVKSCLTHSYHQTGMRIILFMYLKMGLS